MLASISAQAEPAVYDTSDPYINNIGAPEIALLRALSRCPQGATESYLATRHNTAPSTIIRLVEAGLLHTRIHRMAGFSSVSWLMISGTGRIGLKKAESEQCSVQLIGATQLN